MRRLKSKEFKVRLQAAIFLAKARDPRTLGPLTQCAKHEEHYLVRAFCVAALGRIGNPASLPVLKQALQDSHEFVRKRAKAAIEDLAAAGGAGSGYQVRYKPRARVFVLVDTARGRGRGVPSRMKEFMDRNLRQQLNRVPVLEVARSGVAIPDPWLKQRRLPALKVDVRIERVRRLKRRDRVVVVAKVKAVVTRHPANSVVVITTTESESSQEVKGRVRSRELEDLYQQLERQAVDGAIQRVTQRILQVKPG